jgi:predicted dehydrogenase
VDVVSIATPEKDHFHSFQLLAERKKAIYVEKPLATSLDEARAMVELSKSIIAMCGHCLRFESRLAHVFQEREKLGPLRHMSFKNRRVRQQKATYGRVHPAYVLLCHEIELANGFAGVPFRRVCAMETHFSEGQVDGLSALIEYEGGATCTIEGGWLLPTQTAVEENDSIVLDFDAGTYSITLPHTGFTFLGPHGSRSINQQYESSVYGMEFGALRSALEYMVRCVSLKIQPQISTIKDGYGAVRLVDAAIRSAATGQWVNGDS